MEKKKIRGWKRRKRHVQHWKKNNIMLDKEVLREYSRDYVKLWIYPFYALNNYRLPSWYKKLLIDSLIDIYHSWKNELEKDKEYYLKIWIFEKDFMQSQVVIATNNYLNFYDHTFEDLRNSKYVPAWMVTSKTREFSWEEGYTISMYSERDLLASLHEGIYALKEINKWRKSAYLIDEKEDDKVYYLRESKVWIC